MIETSLFHHSLPLKRYIGFDLSIPKHLWSIYPKTSRKLSSLGQERSGSWSNSKCYLQPLPFNSEPCLEAHVKLHLINPGTLMEFRSNTCEVEVLDFLQASFPPSWVFPVPWCRGPIVDVSRHCHYYSCVLGVSATIRDTGLVRPASLNFSVGCFWP